MERPGALGLRECWISEAVWGRCYGFGEGVAKDEVEAYALYNIAAISVPMAAEARGALEKQMSPDQRAAGQRRTKELQKEIAAAQARNAGK